MEIDTVQLNGTEAELDKLVLDSLGKHIEFFNGCQVWLKDDDGLFWGDDPYGQNWACSSSEGWVDSVINWVNYWNESRDETGALIQH